jgi:hypothetical protein
MDDKKPDARTIAEEAVGQTRGSPTPDTAKDQAVAPTDAEAMRQLATSAGPQAGLATKTAESVGERVGDAYADGTMGGATAPSRNIARPAWSQASRAAQQPFVAVAAGFALGYAAALLVHRRD